MDDLYTLIGMDHQRFYRAKHIDRPNPSFIPIKLTGGIGDVIISIDPIETLHKEFDIVVYTGHLEAFKYFADPSIKVFKECPDYLWRIDFNTTAKFFFEEGFHGFLVKEHEDLYLKQMRAFRNDPVLEKLVNHNEDKYFLNAMHGRDHGYNRQQSPLVSLGYELHHDS